MTTTRGQTLPAPGAPLGGSGANDLLGSIVREHLERAAGAPKVAPVEEKGEAAADAAPAEVQEELHTPPEEVQTVQREFSKLFDGESGGTAPEEPAMKGEPRLDLSQGSLSAAELDALLSQDAAAAEASPEAADGASVEQPDAEKALQDAEGVLEAELTQLLAEGMKAEQEKGPREPLAGQTEAHAGSGEAVSETQGPIETPVADAALPAAVPAGDTAQGEANAASAVAAPAAAPEVQAAALSAAAANPAAAAPAAAMPAAPAGMQMPPPVVIEAPEEEAEETPVKRRGGFFKDLMLMVGQVIDLPFAWISSENKDYIGIAAFLLLLGGAVQAVIYWMLR